MLPLPTCKYLRMPVIKYVTVTPTVLVEGFRAVMQTSWTRCWAFKEWHHEFGPHPEHIPQLSPFWMVQPQKCRKGILTACSPGQMMLQLLDGAWGIRICMCSSCLSPPSPAFSPPSSYKAPTPLAFKLFLLLCFFPAPSLLCRASGPTKWWQQSLWPGSHYFHFFCAVISPLRFPLS